MKDGAFPPGLARLMPQFRVCIAGLTDDCPHPTLKQPTSTLQSRAPCAAIGTCHLGALPRTPVGRLLTCMTPPPAARAVHRFMVRWEGGKMGRGRTLAARLLGTVKR